MERGEVDGSMARSLLWAMSQAGGQSVRARRRQRRELEPPKNPRVLLQQMQGLTDQLRSEGMAVAIGEVVDEYGNVLGEQLAHLALHSDEFDIGRWMELSDQLKLCNQARQLVLPIARATRVRPALAEPMARSEPKLLRNGSAIVWEPSGDR